MFFSQKNRTASILILLLLLLFSGNSFAQKDFRPGYIITNEGDTVYGLIDYRGDIRNAQKCVFKKDEGAPEQTFMPFDIKAYRFLNDGKYYISKTITVSGEKRDVFLEFLLKGLTNVYYYRDMNDDHYFIEKSEDGKIYELSNSEMIINTDHGQYMANSNKYIGIMKVIYQDCPSLFPEINKAEFNDKSLIHIAEEYHNKMCEGEKCIIYEKQPPAILIRTGFYAAYRMKFLHFHVAGEPFYSSLEYSTGHSIAPGLTVSFLLPHINEKISLELNGDFSKASFRAETVQESSLGISRDYYEVNTEYSAVNLSFLIVYTFPYKKIRPMIGGGVSSDLTTGQSTGIIHEYEFQDVIYTDYEASDPIGTFSLGPTIEAGVEKTIMNKIPLFFQISYTMLYATDAFFYGLNTVFSRPRYLTFKTGIYF